MKDFDSNNRPQVLLLGNGLNLAYKAKSWEKGIEDIWNNPKMSYQDVKMIETTEKFTVPFPLKAVLATNDSLDSTISGKPEFLLGLEKIDDIRELIHPLLDIKFDYILTTNYSYEIERVANCKVDRAGEYCKNLLCHTNAVSKAESKYLLHTYNSVSYGGFENKVWHIHGEARKPQSVVLGHYYYGKLLEKYNEELLKRKDIQFKQEECGKPMILDSWLDAFIMGDVYILGFGYDFSEMDLWWLLNRKKREKATHGKAYFYSPMKEYEIIKYGLLEAYGAEVRNVGFLKKPENYIPFYDAAIKDISKQVIKNREG